jgi:hypothetical protein
MCHGYFSCGLRLQYSGINQQTQVCSDGSNAHKKANNKL